MLADNSNPEGLATICDLLAKTLIRPLIETPVLRMLSDLQCNLDMLDIEGLSKLWRLAESSNPLYRETFMSQSPEMSSSTLPCTPIGESSPFISSPEPTLSDWADFLDTYLSPTKPKLDHSNPLPENLRYYLLAYLLSATFKDCSIIVRLDFLRTTQEIHPGSVTVIDLDLKRISKLKGWEELDMKIAGTYADGKVCTWS
jgi:inositol-pentakisphosphate 2-kinase